MSLHWFNMRQEDPEEEEPTQFVMTKRMPGRKFVVILYTGGQIDLKEMKIKYENKRASKIWCGTTRMIMKDVIRCSGVNFSRERSLPVTLSSHTWIRIERSRDILSRDRPPVLIQVHLAS